MKIWETYIKEIYLSVLYNRKVTIMEHNFLPYGYKINCREKLIIILRIILFTVIAINSITLYCVLKNVNSRSTVCVKETENKKSAIVSKKQRIKI